MILESSSMSMKITGKVRSMGPSKDESESWKTTTRILLDFSEDLLPIEGRTVLRVKEYLSGRRTALTAEYDEIRRESAATNDLRERQQLIRIHGFIGRGHRRNQKLSTL